MPVNELEPGGVKTVLVRVAIICFKCGKEEMLGEGGTYLAGKDYCSECASKIVLFAETKEPNNAG